MKFVSTSLPDVVLIEPRVFGDARGFFMETFQAKVFSDAGIPTSFVQDNHSGSQRGTLRGLHYQIRHAQGKLMRVIAGEVFDVVVDLRRGSPGFARWMGVVLSADNKHQLWIPPGFAHGFYVTSEWAEVFYKVTDFYAPEWERTLRWDDPDLGISWPLPEGCAPVLSAKDAQGTSLASAEVYD